MPEFANFIWHWNFVWFLESDKGNFVWFDPAYDGDNSLFKTNLSHEEFCKIIGEDFGRDKGFRPMINGNLQNLLWEEWKNPKQKEV